MGVRVRQPGRRLQYRIVGEHPGSGPGPVENPKPVIEHTFMGHTRTMILGDKCGTGIRLDIDNVGEIAGKTLPIRIRPRTLLRFGAGEDATNVAFAKFAEGLGGSTLLRQTAALVLVAGDLGHGWGAYQLHTFPIENLNGVKGAGGNLEQFVPRR